MASAGASSPPPEGRPPRRARAVRWFRRFLWAGAAMLVLAMTVAYLSWHHRLRLLNDWLADLSVPIRVQAGALDWHLGAIRIEAVTLRSRSGVELGRIKRADIFISVASARHNKVDAVAIEGLRFSCSPEEWRALLVKPATNEDPASDAGSTWQMGRMSLVDAAIDLAPRSGSRMQASFDWEGGAMVFTPTQGLQAKSQKVRIHRLEARTGDHGAAEMTGGSVVWSLDPTVRTLDFAEATWSGATLDLTPQLIDFFAPEPPAPEVPSTAAAASPAEPAWTIIVGDAALGFDRFGWHFPAQTEVSGKGTIEGRNFRWDGDWSTEGHRIQVAALEVRAPGGGGASQVKVASLLSQLSRERGGTAVFDSLEFTDPSVNLAIELWGPPAVVSASATPPAPAPVHPLVRIKSGRLTNGTFEMAGLTAAVPTADRPAVRGTLSTRVEELTVFSDGRLTSSARQTLVAENAELGYLDEEPLLQLGKLSVEVVPDEVAAKRTVSRMEWLGGQIRVDGHFLRHFEDSQAPAMAAATGPAGAVVPWWQGLTVVDLTAPEAQVTIAGIGAGVPDASGRLTITTDAADGSYHAVVSDLAAVAPTMPESSLLRAREIVLSAHPSRLWKRRLDSLAVSGVELVIGPALQSLAPATEDPPAATPETSAPPPPLPGESGWHLGRFVMEESHVEISNLVPRLDPVTFQLAFQLDDVPLTPEGLRAQSASQRIELSHLRLNSAYGGTGSISVAEFDHLFVEFSLAGLLDQRLDRVEVISPIIYVGEQLFWYVDYFRKYTSRDALPDDGGDRSKVALASTDRGTIERAAAAGRTDAERAPPPKGWSVNRVDAYYGKFVLALKGSVIDSLPALPFSCSTQLDHGRVDLTLDIPRDTYRPSTRWPLEIDVLEGTASFNLPLKQEDNNLVQVFKASELRYKDFRAHDVFLSMTYDRYGVYGRFGGKLYGGYLSGGGDVYLDDNTSWDGWLVGENIDLGPLTSVLTPNYLSLTGVSQFNIMSFGDSESLYTATGEFTTTTPGQMTIHALTPLKEDLPAVWSKLQRSLTERGVETLRDFPFNECRGKFKLFRQEGDLTLKLAGPLGKRNFDVSLHDHRGPAPEGSR